jgi:FKBP-type peptidyl-prolyl cis-trans isomerase 2
MSSRKGPETKIEAELHGMQDGDSQELILSPEEGIKRTRETYVTCESAGTRDCQAK